MIRVITDREIFRGVLERWITQYPDDHRYLSGIGGTAGERRKKLEALDLETCSRDDIDRALGVAGWADNTCDECQQNKPLIVRIGDYDERFQDLCEDCLESALVALRICK